MTAHCSVAGWRCGTWRIRGRREGTRDLFERRHSYADALPLELPERRPRP